METNYIKVTKEGIGRDESIAKGDIQGKNQHPFGIIFEYKANHDKTIEDKICAPLCSMLLNGIDMGATQSLEILKNDCLEEMSTNSMSILIWYYME